MIALMLVLCSPVRAGEVSLEQVLDRAARGSVENRVAAQELRAARARSREVRSRYLPMVTATGAALWWDAPLEAKLFEGDPCSQMDPALEDICRSMIEPFLGEPIILRESRTQQVEVEAAQPLTGLYGISQGHRATRALERAAEHDARARSAEVALEVVSTYYQALETRHLARVAGAGVETLRAHEARARAFHEQDLLGRNELLQVRVALAEAELGHRRAQVGEALLERKLALLVGAEEPSLSPADVALDTLPPVSVPDRLVADLAADTPELDALEARVEAARADRNRARAELVPQVAAMGSWTRNWGVGSFAASEEAYVGLGVEWEPWAWGRRHYAAQQAAARVRQAELGLEGLRRGVEVEARAALSEVDLARDAWEASGISVEQAAENLRIVDARFRAHSVTATDLLEAESLHSGARADRVVAAFDYLEAVARAQVALGLPVDPGDGLVVEEVP